MRRLPAGAPVVQVVQAVRERAPAPVVQRARAQVAEPVGPARVQRERQVQRAQAVRLAQVPPAPDRRAPAPRALGRVRLGPRARLAPRVRPAALAPLAVAERAAQVRALRTRPARPEAVRAALLEAEPRPCRTWARTDKNLGRRGGASC